MIASAAVSGDVLLVVAALLFIVCCIVWLARRP